MSSPPFGARGDSRPAFSLALPLPSLPLPWSALPYVVQGVSVLQRHPGRRREGQILPLPCGFACLGRFSSSAWLLSLGFLLPSGAPGIAAGRAATACSTFCLPCRSLMALWGFPSSRVMVSVVVLISGAVSRVLGSCLLPGLGGDALCRRALAVAAEDGRAPLALPIARLRNAGAALTREEVPEGLRVRVALWVAAH